MSKYVGKKDTPLSMSEMLGGLTDALIQQATKPNLYGYTPHDKQQQFHSSQDFGRLFIGGNQSGKTTSGVVEDLWWVTKRHPYRNIPSHLKIAGRAISVDFVEGVERILIPEFKRWVLPSDLKNGSWEDSWDNYRHMLTFADGSFIEFLTYEQSLEKHAGAKRHFIHFDEEPPESIFGENMARLLAQDPAAWWITMTPTQGITWVDDRMVSPKNGRPDGLFVVQVNTEDNTHLPAGTVKRTLGMLSADEQKIRQEGLFVPRGGLVFPEFQRTIHGAVPENFRPPLDWTIWMSMDSGWNNPTAILYSAVSPNMEQIVTFHEIYGNERTVKEWAQEMHDFERQYGLKVYVRVGDPAMKQTREITGTSVAMEYANNGINLALDSIPKDTSIGVAKMRQYLKPNPRNGNYPFWRIVGTSCPHLVDQMKKLEWDSIQSEKLRGQKNKPETIKKRNDHAPDAVRYMFTAFPDLTDKQLTEKYSDEVFVENDYIQTLVNMAESPPDAYRPISKRSMWKQELWDEDDYV